MYYATRKWETRPSRYRRRRQVDNPARPSRKRQHVLWDGLARGGEAMGALDGADGWKNRPK
jgi:hypothetical protein